MRTVLVARSGKNTRRNGTHRNGPSPTTRRPSTPSVVIHTLGSSPPQLRWRRAPRHDDRSLVGQRNRDGLNIAGRPLSSFLRRVQKGHHLSICWMLIPVIGQPVRGSQVSKLICFEPMESQSQADGKVTRAWVMSPVEAKAETEELPIFHRSARPAPRSAPRLWTSRRCGSQSPTRTRLVVRCSGQPARSYQRQQRRRRSPREPKPAHHAATCSWGPPAPIIPCAPFVVVTQSTTATFTSRDSFRADPQVVGQHDHRRALRTHLGGGPAPRFFVALLDRDGSRFDHGVTVTRRPRLLKPVASSHVPVLANRIEYLGSFRSLGEASGRLTRTSYSPGVTSAGSWTRNG